jgi:radical SAM domain protein
MDLVYSINISVTRRNMMNTDRKIIGQFHDIYDCRSVTLNISNQCQLACRYCFEHDKNGTLMSFDTAKKIIDEVALSRKGNPFSISLFGGEPFLNWDVIHKMLRYIDEKNYPMSSIGATTNLVLLTDDMLEDIVKYNFYLLISIDGTKDVHDWNRSNSFDQVYKNLIKLINSGLPSKCIKARLTVTPDTCSRLFDSFKFIWDLGIHRLAPMTVRDTEWSEEELSAYAEQNRKIMEFYIDYINSEGLQDDEAHIKNVSDLITALMSEGHITASNCQIDTIRRCTVDTNGDIYPCHQMPYFDDIEPLGNIHEGIYTHPNSYHDVIKVKYDLDRCDGCVGKYVCRMACAAQNHRMTNDMKIPHMNDCAIAKIHAMNTLYIHDVIMKIKDLKHPMLKKLKENLLVKYKMDEIFSGDVFSNKNILTDIKDIQDDIIRLKNNKILMCELETTFKIHMTGIMNYMRDFINYVKVGELV